MACFLRVREMNVADIVACFPREKYSMTSNWIAKTVLSVDASCMLSEMLAISMVEH